MLQRVAVWCSVLQCVDDKGDGTCMPPCTLYAARGCECTCICVWVIQSVRAKGSFSLNLARSLARSRAHSLSYSFAVSLFILLTSTLTCISLTHAHTPELQAEHPHLMRTLVRSDFHSARVVVAAFWQETVTLLAALHLSPNHLVRSDCTESSPELKASEAFRIHIMATYYYVSLNCGTHFTSTAVLEPGRHVK